MNSPIKWTLRKSALKIVSQLYFYVSKADLSLINNVLNRMDPTVVNLNYWITKLQVSQ